MCAVGLHQSKLYLTVILPVVLTIILPVVLYECERRSFTLKEQHKLKVSENALFTRLFYLMRVGRREEDTGGCQIYYIMRGFIIYTVSRILLMYDGEEKYIQNSDNGNLKHGDYVEHRSKKIKLSL
jgi:hypothetical protein